MIRNRLLCRGALVGCAFALISAPANAQSTDLPASSSSNSATSDLSPREVVLPSAAPSGEARNDRIPISFYPAQRADGLPVDKPAPAVILLHPLGSNLKLIRKFAVYLARHGVNAALIDLPYHGRRSLPGVNPADRFAGGDAKLVAQAFTQSASDALTTLDWLEKQPGVDAERLGAVGLSLGAIITHLVMGQDARLKAGVAILGGANLLDISRGTSLGRLLFGGRTIEATPENKAILAPADPLTYANNNQPRRVLMIQAARDDIVPARTAQELWEALGRPPIQWLDVNHVGLILVQKQARKATLAYLRNVWSGQPDAKVPQIRAITLKTGAISGITSIDAAVQWQALTLAKKSNHQSLLSGNLGVSTHGPFVSVAATINSYIDVGVARRFSGSEFHPYVSVHLVF